jgi:glycosyltransferase involved in cell wall biosynthesis
MRKLKILYYSNAFIANHGGRLHSEAFLKEAQLHPFVNSILSFPNSEVQNEESGTNSGIIRKTLKSNPLLQVVLFYRRNYKSLEDIFPVIEAEKPNILHIRLDSNFLIIKKIKRKYPELLLTTEVNASPFDENFQNIIFRKIFRRLERNQLKHADANFFVSANLRQRIMLQHNDKRDFVVHNGVDLKFFKIDPHRKTLKSKITFGYIGTIDYHKNLNRLIDSFKTVHETYRDKVELLIVGNGPLYNELIDYVKEKNLKDAVRFTGWVSHNQIGDYLQEIDVAIHHFAKPYMSPLKIFEYLATGKAVIGPDTPAVREIFSEDEMLFVKQDLSNLVSKMFSLYDNDELRVKIAKKGRQRVFEHFKWEDNADKIISVMNNKFNENN